MLSFILLLSANMLFVVMLIDFMLSDLVPLYSAKLQPHLDLFKYICVGQTL
jgi:hypothetical protein